MVEQIIYQYHNPAGRFARSTATGMTVMWVGILLGLYLLLYFFISH